MVVVDAVVVEVEVVKHSLTDEVGNSEEQEAFLLLPLLLNPLRRVGFVRLIPSRPPVRPPACELPRLPWSTSHEHRRRGRRHLHHHFEQHRGLNAVLLAVQQAAVHDTIYLNTTLR